MKYLLKSKYKTIFNKFKKTFMNNKGFTLLEIIIVISIMGLLLAVFAPRLGDYLGKQRDNYAFLKSFIAETFNDSFLRKCNNFLAIHLHTPFADPENENNEYFSRSNGVSVLTFNEEKKLVKSSNHLLAYKNFADNFRIDTVILSNGQHISEGTVLIPFSADGFSDNTIIHITINNEIESSLVISKFQKEPLEFENHITFDQVWKDVEI